MEFRQKGLSFKVTEKQVASRPVQRSAMAVLALFGLFSSYSHSQTLQSNPFATPTVDCTDEVNAENPACQSTGPSQAAEGRTTGTRERTPQGASFPQTYNDTENLYIDRSAGGFARFGDIERRNTFSRPEPLTEFQKLVAATTQMVLPVYGSSLFRSSQPSTFAPADHVSVPPEFTIGPGDEILLRVWGQVTLNARLTVDRGGSIYVPKVGEVHVAGLPYSGLQDALRSHIGRLYRNFDLNVNLGQLRSIQLFVVGQSRSPGSYTISALSTLVNAIFASGGPTSQGSMRNITLRRNGQVVTVFDLYDLLLKGDKSRDSALQSGDVVYFSPVGSAHR